MITDTSTQFTNSVRENGLRMTKQRVLILDILRKSREHLDAEALHDRARILDPQIGLATVYRTLALLKNFGLVNEYDLGEEHGHFETTPLTPHHHFTCLECKRVIEFEVPCIDSFIKDLMLGDDMIITRVHLSFEGYCSTCRGKLGA
jgi:Fe2+ or Zn2+ uptake regulation protein